MAIFANSVDVYTDLQPWLDIKTWARLYTVTQLEPTHADSSMFIGLDMRNELDALQE